MATYTVTSASDTPVDGRLTLRQAIEAANTNAGADTIKFDTFQMQGSTITLAGSELTIADDVTIEGGTGITVSANGASRVLSVTGNPTTVRAVELDNLTITGGYVSGKGGGIYAGVGTALTLTDVTVTRNTATGTDGRGGGVYGQNRVTATNSTFSYNSGDEGGGLAVDRLYLTDSTVTRNRGSGAGGGIYTNYGLIKTTTVTLNGSYGDGGGIYGNTLVVQGGTVYENLAANGSGGGIASANLTLTGAQITDNRADGTGGGVRATTATVTDSTFYANVSASHGAGLYAVTGNVEASLFLENSTSVVTRDGPFTGNGGGIAGKDLDVVNSTLVLNKADVGGGIYGLPGGSVTVVHGTIVRNEASTGSGIGVATSGETPLNLTNSLVIANTGASQLGGFFRLTETGRNIRDDATPYDTIFGSNYLANNGGPTQTVALLDDPSNPAIAAGGGVAGLPTDDQRHDPRPAPTGTAPDLGAFELDQTFGSTFVGTAAADVLRGTNSGDTMRGLGGDDVLFGRGGRDHLRGGGGDDVLHGRLGLDDLKGGAGADRFVYTEARHAPHGTGVFDEILDFSRREGDRIDLRGIDAKAGVAGNQPFDYVGRRPLDDPGDLRVRSLGDGNFLVSGQIDRDAAPDFSILVRTEDDLGRLVRGDFLL